MSKSDGATKHQAKTTIPLADVTLTWRRGPHYIGEMEGTPMTIAGRELGVILQWLSLTKPDGDFRSFGSAQFTPGSSTASAHS